MQHQGSTARVQDQVISPEETAESPSLMVGIRRYWNASVCAGLSPCEAAVFAWVFDRSVFEPRLAGSRKVRPVVVPIREIGRRYGFDPGGISKAMARLTSRRILLETPQGCRVNPRLDDWDKLSPECLAWLQTDEATFPLPHAVHLQDRINDGPTPSQRGVDERQRADSRGVDERQRAVDDGQRKWAPEDIERLIREQVNATVVAVQRGVDARQRAVDERQQAPDLLLDVRAPASDSVDFSSIPVSPPVPALSENICVCNLPETPAPTLACAREGEKNTHIHTHKHGFSISGDQVPEVETLARATRLAERSLRDDVVNLIDEYQCVFPSSWILTIVKRVLAVCPEKFNRGYILKCLRNAHRVGEVGSDAEADYDDEMKLLPRGSVQKPGRRPELRANAGAYLPYVPPKYDAPTSPPVTASSLVLPAVPDPEKTPVVAAPVPDKIPVVAPPPRRDARVAADISEADFQARRNAMINALKDRSQNHVDK